MKKIIITLLFSIVLLSSCKKENSNPVNPGTSPSPPDLALPIDAASDLNIPTCLKWKTNSNTDSCTLQISLSSSLNNPVFNQSGLTRDSQEVTGLNYMTVYYWRVKASNKYGTSEWSKIWSFTTTGSAPVPPDLLSPANALTGVSIFPALNWNSTSAADSFTLQLSENSSFTSFVYNRNGIKNTNQQIDSLKYLTRYFWRVNAANKYGTSEWSNTFYFTTTEHIVVSFDITQSKGNNGIIFYVTPNKTVTFTKVNVSVPDAHFNQDYWSDGTTVYPANQPVEINEFVGVQSGQKWIFLFTGNIGSHSGIAFTDSTYYTVP
jgi:hypothetical protein